MLNRLKTLSAAVASAWGQYTPQSDAVRRTAMRAGVLAAACVLAYGFATHPLFYTVQRGEVAERTNLFSGSSRQFGEGRILLIPGVYEARSFPLRDQIYRPMGLKGTDGGGPLQSIEGLSLGLDMTVRYALDPKHLAGLPDDVNRDIVDPAVQGVVYKLIAQHTVREIFSSERAQIQQVMESDLRAKLAAEGLILRAVQIGKVELPEDYRKGMDGLLAESLASDKMRYTLELKDKQVKQTELEAQADKARREIAAEAAGREEIIAAKAQEEAMAHVIPFKKAQIEQRKLEAQAQAESRVQVAEGEAKARQIEAAGEAQARDKLADAETYRFTRLGKANVDQMAAEGALLTQHPLLVQKAMADKLSDKVQVIIAPPGSGGFIGNALLGVGKPAKTDGAEQSAQANQASPAQE